MFDYITSVTWSRIHLLHFWPRLPGASASMDSNPQRQLSHPFFHFLVNSQILWNLLTKVCWFFRVLFFSCRDGCCNHGCLRFREIVSPHYSFRYLSLKFPANSSFRIRRIISTLFGCRENLFTYFTFCFVNDRYISIFQVAVVW